MKFLKIIIAATLIFFSLAAFGQNVQLKATFSYDNFEGKIPDNYVFTYDEENGKTVINITEESTIYDVVKKYDIPVNRLNATWDNYQFWQKKYISEGFFNHPYKKAILINLMTVMKPKIVF